MTEDEVPRRFEGIPVRISRSEGRPLACSRFDNFSLDDPG